MTPRFASALSTSPDATRALEEAGAGLLAGLDGAEPDLLAVFATHHYGAALEDLGRKLADATGAAHTIGCTGESVIGATREVEGQPGLAAWAASLPTSDVRPFEVTAAAGAGGVVFEGSPAPRDPGRASVLVLGDPFSFPMPDFLARMNAEHPGVPIVGGMASGGNGPGQNLLLTADGVRDRGAIGVTIEGGVDLRPVVSQGCRPIGKPWVITACEGNRVDKLGGKSALAAVAQCLQEVDLEDRELFRAAPFIGLAVEANKSEFDRGDFLVRGFVGMDPERGAFAVGDHVRRGQTIQFLVRDAASAGDDLLHLLRTQGGGESGADAEPRSVGALLFSCNGRGTRMFPAPDHDVGCLRAGLGPELPVAGFFAAGEIGPVAGQNFLHGFTASVAVFRPRSE